MAIAAQYYICNKCPFRTTLFSRIEDHLLIHRDTKEPFSYFDCFDRLKPLKCPSCDFSTESLVLLRYHLVHNHDQQHFVLKAKLKTCKNCRFCTHSNYLWIRHPIFGSCKDKKESKEKKRVRVSIKKNKRWHLCEKCNYRTINLRDFKNHVINKHIRLEEIDWQNCKTCTAKFKTLHTLKQHQKSHHLTAVDHLNCPECDYSTYSRSFLRRHFNNKHARPEEIKWVECYHCGAKFKEKDNLRRHLVIHATNGKQYKCDQCPFETHHKHYLKIHIVHRHATNGKQYKCDQCPFETHQKCNLNRHIVNRHLKKEEIKWHKCQYCDHKTKNKYNIRIHIKSKHSKSVELLQCPHCSLKSKTDTNLRYHILRHHDDSAFKCDLCNYRAKLEKNIEIHKQNKHKNIHVVGDVKLFKCEHCDYNSKYKTNLKRHILVKHNIDGKVFNCKECDYKTHAEYNLSQHIGRMHNKPTF